jgi:hypothetical protein
MTMTMTINHIARTKTSRLFILYFYPALNARHRPPHHRHL